MPRSYHLKDYGPEYELMLLHAAREGLFSLTLPSNAHAKIFRMKVYAYFNALRKETPPREDLLMKVELLALKVTGPEFQICTKADTWDSQAIRSALSITKDDLPPQLPTAQSLLRAKLVEIRAQKLARTQK